MGQPTPAVEIKANDGIEIDGTIYKVTDAHRAVYTARDGEQHDRVAVTYWLPGMGRPGRTYFAADATTDTILRGAFTKLTKAQAEFLRLVKAGHVSFSPSNRDWAAPSVAHRDMFTTFANGRKSNRTLAGTALYGMGLIDIVGGRREVALTEAGHNWLAAHPA